jgi:hypothetical protein
MSVITSGVLSLSVSAPVLAPPLQSDLLSSLARARIGLHAIGGAPSLPYAVRFLQFILEYPSPPV